MGGVISSLATRGRTGQQGMEEAVAVNLEEIFTLK